MFTDGSAFVCFYDAERVLSEIAKFLVHLLREREGRGDMGHGLRDTDLEGRAWEGRGSGVRRRRDAALPSCKISRRSVSPSPRYLSPGTHTHTHTHTPTHTITAALISDKTHTSAAFVG